MNVRVLFFGLLTDIAGAGPHSLSLPPGATVQTLLEELFRRWPALQLHAASLLTAVNRTYARPGEVIPPEAEVAIMPPVQGG